MKITNILDLFLDQQDEEFTQGVRAYQGQNYALALRVFEQLAQRNDPQAQINLALMLKAGEGTPADPVTAHMWLELAARNGDVIAASERDHLRSHLSLQQLEQANQLAANWAPPL